MNCPIPFHRPTLVGTELAYLREALERRPTDGHASFSDRAEEFLEQEMGRSRVLLTPSCAGALEICALLLNIAPGDEVIVPSFTFVASAAAFHQLGARVIFADIRPDTLNIDEEQVQQLITPRTRAIVAVHYAGIAANVRRLLELGVPVIEDNAHGLFGKYSGQPLGSFGHAATLSFHSTKNFTCGEGGALILNHSAWIERAEIIRENGTNRKQFLRGLVDKYTWIDRGSSFRLSDILAAALLAQLERHQEIQSLRRCLWERYLQALAPWAAAHRFRLPCVPPGCEPSYHMFYLLAPDSGTRDRLFEHLFARGVRATFHYVPLHSSPFGQAFAHAPLGCPVAEETASRIVRLPFFTALSEEQQDHVIRTLWEFASCASHA